MNPTQQNLLLLCLNEKDTFQTKSTIGFTCNCSFATFHNRVLVGDNFELAELACAKKLHKHNPYTLWLDAKNVLAKNKLTGNAFAFGLSFPEMMLELKNLPTSTYNSHITIRQAATDYEILAIWIPMVIKAYNPQISQTDYEKYLHDWHTFFGYLRHSTAYPHMHFFLGYWEKVAAATGLCITKNDAVYIHWIGTLPEFRHRGLGNAMASMPLQHFKRHGAEKAFLFASAMGKPLYEKIGFTTTGQIDAYRTHSSH